MKLPRRVDDDGSMKKNLHEIRDPIHVFIRMESPERQILNSRSVQRLRHIHQLALTHLIYPGATHRRFEHSLGVMELAGRVYDIVTDPDNIIDNSVRTIVPPKGTFEHSYWRRVVRMAALCHDIGHLPFSHAAERELLPAGWNHERLSVSLILDSDLAQAESALKLNPTDVARIAVGPKHFSDGPFGDWETILSEIITGNSFGVDRIDYLLRDSVHSGVAYGKFDHFRLIDTLPSCPAPWRVPRRLSGERPQGSGLPRLARPSACRALSSSATTRSFRARSRRCPRWVSKRADCTPPKRCLLALLHVHAALLSSHSPHLRHPFEDVSQTMARRRDVLNRARRSPGSHR